MKTAKFLFLAIAMLLCGTTLKAQKPVVDGVWKIKSVKDGGKLLDLSAKETTVEINVKAKTILAYVGCNRMNAKFEFITSDQIKPFALASTRKACHGETETIENATRYALEQTNSIRKNGARIEFFKDNDLLIVLERPAAKKKK